MNFNLKHILDNLKAKPYVLGNKRRVSNYPSSASVSYEKNGTKVTEGACLRSEWYDYKGFSKYFIFGPSSPRMARILEMGEKYADVFIDEIKMAGLFVGKEVPFEIEKYKISGRVDCLIKDPTCTPPPPQRPHPDGIIGVEFKTVGGYQGKKGPIISTRDTPLFPKSENILQTLIYLYYYSKFGVKTWLLVYIDRGLGDSEASPEHWQVHEITIDDDGHPVVTNNSGTVTITDYTVQSVLDRYALLNEYVSKDVLPPRDYEIQYSNSKIKSMFSDLSETDQKAVTRAAKKIGKPLIEITNDDPNLLAKGDWRCSYCAFKELCYSDNPDKPPKNLMIEKPKPKEENIDMEDIA